MLYHGAQKAHQIVPNEGSSAKRPRICVWPGCVYDMVTHWGAPGMADSLWQSAQVPTSKHCMVTVHVSHSAMPSHMDSRSKKLTFRESRLRHSKCLGYWCTWIEMACKTSPTAIGQSYSHFSESGGNSLETSQKLYSGVPRLERFLVWFVAPCYTLRLRAIFAAGRFGSAGGPMNLQCVVII